MTSNTAPRVKALEWRASPIRENSYLAPHGFGENYVAYLSGDPDGNWWRCAGQDHTSLEAAKAAAQADYEARILAALEPQEAEPADPEIFDWLETELSAIGIWYRGDPSYEHDAYWFRDRVRELFKRGRDIFPSAPVPASEKAAGMTNAMMERAYDAFTRSFSSSPIGTNNTRRDLRAALEAALGSHPVQGSASAKAEEAMRELVERAQHLVPPMYITWHASAKTALAGPSSKEGDAS